MVTFFLNCTPQGTSLLRYSPKFRLLLLQKGAGYCDLRYENINFAN